MPLQLTLSKPGAAVVFGGSGGVGAAISRRLAETGSSVAITYHSNQQSGLKLRDELIQLGVQCKLWQLDLRDSYATRQVVHSIDSEFGGIHTVIYAAGPKIGCVLASEVEPSFWRDVFESDVIGFINIMHASVPFLRHSGGSIVACTTSAVRLTLDRDGLSGAPKAAITSLVSQLAVEEGVHQVRANTVGIGWLEVGMGTLPSDQPLAEARGEGAAIAFEAITSRIRLGARRPGSGEELANAVVFMASDQASYITGQTIYVDGGYTA